MYTAVCSRISGRVAQNGSFGFFFSKFSVILFFFVVFDFLGLDLS